MKRWIIAIALLVVVGVSAAIAGGDWTDGWIAHLSSGDCKGIASHDKSWCDTNDCKGIASGDKSRCDSSDCKGVASHDKSWCSGNLCKGWASKDKSWCNDSD